MSSFRASKYALVVRVFDRADEHDVVALQIGDDHVADGNQGWIAAGEGLNRYLSAAEKYQLDIETMLAEYPFVLGNPELRLARADRRITDANFTERLSLSTSQDRYLKSAPTKMMNLDSSLCVMSLRQPLNRVERAMQSYIDRSVYPVFTCRGGFTMGFISTMLLASILFMVAASPVSAQLKKVRISVSAASIAEVPFRIAHVKRLLS